MIHQDQGLPVRQDEAAVHDCPFQSGGAQALYQSAFRCRHFPRVAHDVAAVPAL